MFFKSLNLEKATWKDDGKKFSFKIDGKDVTKKVLFDYCGDSLMVYYPKKEAVYILYYFDSFRDGQWQEANYLDRETKMYCFRTHESVHIWFEGQDISDEVVLTTYDNIMLIYYPENESTYVIEKMDPIEEKYQMHAVLVSSTTWFCFEKVEKNTFRIFYKGRQLTGELLIEVYDKIAVAYEVETNSYLLLKWLDEMEDGEFQPITILSTDEEALWCYSKKSVNFIIDGRDVSSETKGSMVDDDYIVYHEPTSTTYYLENFAISQSDDRHFHVAIVLSRSVQFFWKASENSLSIYFKGEQILTSDDDCQLSGNDIVVASNKLQTMIHIPNYRNLKDNVLRPVG